MLKDDPQGSTLGYLEIQKQLIQSRPDQSEMKLLDYIKYLLGQHKNTKFTLDRKDYSQQFELGQKSIDKDVSDYIKETNNALSTVANDIIEIVDYNTVHQKVAEPISAIRYKENPKYAFLNQCKHDGELALPLLAKVVNKQLSLLTYKLGDGHVKALCKTFALNPDCISRYYFQNCGISESALEHLISQFQILDRVISFCIK